MNWSTEHVKIRKNDFTSTKSSELCLDNFMEAKVAHGGFNEDLMYLGQFLVSLMNGTFKNPSKNLEFSLLENYMSIKQKAKQMANLICKGRASHLQEFVEAIYLI